jgi:hypothetical protein
MFALRWAIAAIEINAFVSRVVTADKNIAHIF